MKPSNKHNGRCYVLVVGAGSLQIPAIKKVRERGLSVMVVDKNPEAPGFEYADLYAQIDIYDYGSMVNWIREAGQSIAGVMTMATDCSYSVAQVAAEFGLPGIPPDSALTSVDKGLFRKALKNAGIFVPDFAVARNMTSALDGQIKFPLVVKPVDNMGSRGVMKVCSASELEEAAAKAFSFSRSSTIILESFLEGAEYSLDACMLDGKCYPLGFADRIIEYAPFFVETGYTMPSSLNDEERKSLLLLLEKAAQGIGVMNGIVKGDLKITDDGPVLLEMAVRLSGNRMSSDAIPLSCGIDAVGVALDFALGCSKPPPVAIYERGYAYRALLPKPGKVKKIRGISEACMLEGVVDVVVHIREGDTKKPFTCSADSIGYVISHAKTRKTAEKRVQKALDTIQFDMI